MRYLLLLVSCVAWGQAGYIPAWPDGSFTNQSISSQTIDATGEKVSYCGTNYAPDGASHSIRKVGVYFNTVVKAGGSALTLSLQDPSTSTGPPMQPDGTQDQTVAISNASIASTTFVLSGALSADRAVAFGEAVCVVVEFDGSGRLGSDSFGLGSTSRGSGNPATFAETALFTASWASASRLPIVIFEYSDATYGTLDGASVFSAANTSVAYNSGSATDEYALKFTVPMNGYIDGVFLNISIAAGADFDVVLYSGTTSLASKSIDANWWSVVVNGLGGLIAFPKTTVSTGTTYYLSVKPTTANNVTLGGYTVASAAYLAAMPQGTGYIRSGRVDAGSWSETSTVLPSIRFRFTPTANSGAASGAYVVAQ